MRAFRDEPSLAAGRVSGHHQILVIHAPRGTVQVERGADKRQVGQRLGEVPLLLSARLICSAYGPTWLA